MSDIPAARFLLEEAIALQTDPRAVRVLQRALLLMWREPPCRKASARTVRVTDLQRARARRLAHTTDLTITQIADKVGLRNSGRVSEILNGKR